MGCGASSSSTSSSTSSSDKDKEPSSSSSSSSSSNKQVSAASASSQEKALPPAQSVDTSLAPSVNGRAVVSGGLVSSDEDDSSSSSEDEDEDGDEERAKHQNSHDNEDTLTESTKHKLESVINGAHTSIASTYQSETRLRSHPLAGTSDSALPTPPTSAAGGIIRPNTRHKRVPNVQDEEVQPPPPLPEQQLAVPRPSPQKPHIAQVSGGGVTRNQVLGRLRGDAAKEEQLPSPRHDAHAIPPPAPPTARSLERPQSRGHRPATRNTAPVSVQLLAGMIEGGVSTPRMQQLQQSQEQQHQQQQNVPLLPSVAARQQELERAQVVVEHARYLEMDVVADADLLWIAEQALAAPMPDGWEQYTLPDGETPYYFNVETRQTQWCHPLEPQFRALYRSMRAEKMARNTAAAEKAANQEKSAVSAVAMRALKGIEESEVGGRRVLNSAGTDSTWEDSTFSDATSLGTTRTGFEDSFGSALTGSLNVSSYHGASSTRGLSLNMKSMSFSKDAREASKRRGGGAPAFLPKWLRSSDGALKGDDVRS